MEILNVYDSVVNTTKIKFYDIIPAIMPDERLKLTLSPEEILALYPDDEGVSEPIPMPLLDLPEDVLAKLDADTTALIRQGHSLTLFVPLDGTVLRVAQSSVGNDPAHVAEAGSIEQALISLVETPHDPQFPAGNRHFESRNVQLPMARSSARGTLGQALLDGWSLDAHFSPNARAIGVELTRSDERAFAIGESFFQAVERATERIILQKAAKSV